MKKVKVADFGFYKIIGWAFQSQFLPGGGEGRGWEGEGVGFKQTYLQNFKCPGGYRGRDVEVSN